MHCLRNEVIPQRALQADTSSGRYSRNFDSEIQDSNSLGRSSFMNFAEPVTRTRVVCSQPAMSCIHLSKRSPPESSRTCGAQVALETS